MYSLTEKKKNGFVDIFVLYHMVKHNKKFSLLLNENESFLSDILDRLFNAGLIDIINDNYYEVSEKGIEKYKLFVKRYFEFLNIYDVFSAVDLESGEFAFEQILTHDNFEDYISEDRWEDLRVAVCEFKNIDPIEIVFMSFINEDRFGFDQNGKWCFDLLVGNVWDDILEICNSAISIDELGYVDEDGNDINGNDVIEDIVAEGFAVVSKLKEEEDKLEQESSNESYDLYEDDDYEEEDDDISYSTVEVACVVDDYCMMTDEIYDNYYDPYYCSPVWRGSLYY